MKKSFFEIIPAIDILEGKCVRLTQGKFSLVEEFSTNPLDIAKKWEDLGATRLHIVDLDGARSGCPVNQNIIYKIASGTNAKLQVGGGIRTLKCIKDYLNGGISYVILGTGALLDRSFLKEAVSLYPKRTILGLDIKNGRLALSGWQETKKINLEKLSSEVEEVKQIIYTNVARDGTLAGPDLRSIKEITSFFSSEIIISGGITKIDNIVDILKLKKEKHPNICGVILGKALYKGLINLSNAISLVKEELT